MAEDVLRELARRVGGGERDEHGEEGALATERKRRNGAKGSERGEVRGPGWGREARREESEGRTGRRVGSHSSESSAWTLD